jgi:alkylglycerol monooxygenase
MNFVIYAIPFFFLLIAIELLAEKWRHTDYYRVNDAINSLSAGVLSQMTGLVKKMLPFTLYLMVFDQIQVFSLPDTWWMWVFAFVAYDFLYYWNHRLGHEINVLWAAHVVHHSSEEYNLTTALRQTSGSFLSWIFYLPLAVLGVDPFVLISVGSLNLIYQFWVHTRHIPKLGWIEWVFVTPSNHRVHHAQNAMYLDKNYGGVFILWDRLFGTFQDELSSETPIYGVRKALKSWNPLWANIQVYNQLFKDSLRTKRWQDKLGIWFRPTGWRPSDVEQKYPLEKTDLQHFTKFDVSISNTAKCYAILQHGITVALGLVVLLGSNELGLLAQLGLIGLIVFGSYSLGSFMEQKPIAVVLEVFKTIFVLAMLAYFDWETTLAVGFAVACCLSLCLLYLCVRQNKVTLVAE